MTYRLIYPRTNQSQIKRCAKLLVCLLFCSVCGLANSAPYTSEASALNRQEANTFSQIINDGIQRISSYFSDSNNKKSQTSTEGTNLKAIATKDLNLNSNAIDTNTIDNIKIASNGINSNDTNNNNELIDIWPRVRDGFQLPSDTGRDIETNIQNKILQQELNWYANNPEYIQRVLERAEPFLFYILEETKKYNLPTELVLLPIVESAFRPFAYSHGRAAGLWQFIPFNWARLWLKTKLVV